MNLKKFVKTYRVRRCVAIIMLIYLLNFKRLPKDVKYIKIGDKSNID